jgi:SAM-dependent methyltransferase
MADTLNLLNLGCGERLHPDWVNVDIHSESPHVQAHDISRGIPFPDASFSAVYLSHVLEHFSQPAGLVLLRECHRVLRPSGIIRVVVPNLEIIAELYLQELHKLTSDSSRDTAAYDWMTIELYDQTVRDKSSGQMFDFIQRADPRGLDFIRGRLGGELDRILGFSNAQTPKPKLPSFVSRFLSAAQRKLLRLVVGRDGIRAYDAGRFRLSGEIHLWMYDRFSLARALQEAGFLDPACVEASESSIPGWNAFNLDTEPDGRIYKPDSLYMEAARP